VCYSNWAKIFILEVQSGSLKKFGAVSDVVALEMVVGLDKKLQKREECKWPTFCLSTTGITGPTGGLEKPLGLVWFGFNGSEGLKKQKKIFTGSRINIRDLAVDWALYILIMLSAK
jgi:PncC family amidohydrolase